MRLRAEQLLDASFDLINESPVIGREKSDLRIVTDTILPSTPQRVEGDVPVALPAHEPRGKVKSDTAQPIQVDAAVVAKNPVQSVDAVKVAPQFAKDRDSTYRTNDPVIRRDSVVVRQPIMEATPTTVIEILLPQHELIDTIIYPSVIDSVKIDTIAIAEPKSTIALLMKEQKEGKALPMSLDRSDGIFALLVVCFLLLAHVYHGGIAFLKENMMLVFSSSKSEKLETQTTTKEIFYSYFLVFLAVLLISISLYEAFERFIPVSHIDKSPFVTIGAFTGLILLFILTKMTINKLIGYVFDIEKKLNVWNRSYLVLLSIFGLLCFLPTLMLVYSSLWHSIIIGFVLVLFLIVQIILFLRIIFFFIRRKFNFLYLIAYLCTIEILPYIFLGIGLVYLYGIDIFNTLL